MVAMENEMRTDAATSKKDTSHDVYDEQQLCFATCDYDGADEGGAANAVHVRSCAFARNRLDDPRYVDGEVKCPHCGGAAEVPEFRWRGGQFARPRILPCGVCVATGFVSESVADAYEPPAEDDRDYDESDDYATLRRDVPHPAAGVR